MEEKFFFDSYAIIEINISNENYKKYSEKEVFTTVLNLGEVYYHYLKNHNKETAEYWNTKTNAAIIDISVSVVLEAMQLKWEHKKSNLSMADCIGYILAKKNNLKFLTGDEKFEKMTNVEFVK